MDLSVEFFFLSSERATCQPFQHSLHIRTADRQDPAPNVKKYMYIYTHIQYINMDGKHALITVL